MRIIFLGTSGSLPTSKRSLPSIAIRRKGELILFDCGEGTQQRMVLTKVGFCRKTKIFITHMHGDHVLGLPGLIQTMSLLDRKKPLEIYGPSGIREFVDSVMKTVRFTLTFKVDIHEVEEGVAYSGSEYRVQAIWADHVIPNLAYAIIEEMRPGRFYPEKAEELGVPKGPLWSKLQRGTSIKLKNGKIVRPEEVMDPPRPGRKIVYTGDTRPSGSVIELASNANILIHDSTFDDSMTERARRDGHTTPGQVAQIAKEAGVERLFLIHISARYDNPKMLLEQAKKIFPNSEVAEDLMELELHV